MLIRKRHLIAPRRPRLRMAALVISVALASVGYLSSVADAQTSGPTVVFGPVSSPRSRDSSATQTVNETAAPLTHLMSHLTSDPIPDGRETQHSKASAGTTPEVTNQNPQCALWQPFVLVIGDLDTDCLQGIGVYTEYISDLNILSNNTGYRVWFHEYADGSGWADCFNTDNAYELFGRDTNPGNIQVSANSSNCPSTPGHAYCPSLQPMAFSIGSAGMCYYSPVTYLSPDTPIYYLTNGSGYRVWLHEYKNGSGWADCFSNNNAYETYGTRDETPGNLQVTSNSSACP